MLSELNCRFEQGQVTALLGHNGAGKTTIIRIMLGLVKADQGKILFAGKALSQDIKGKIGYMPEINKLPLALTPVELLTTHLKLYRVFAKKNLKERVAEQLKQVGLWEHRKKPIKQLSKGMGRRVAWALATSHEPELLLLDEPFSGLDPVGRAQMLSWIEQLVGQGKTLILCTHELAYLPRFCQSFYVIKNGRIVFSHQQTAQVSQQSYELIIKAPPGEEMVSIQQRFGLPGPTMLACEQGELRMLFPEYQVAALWLQNCITQSFEVRAFSPQRGFNENDILQYFA